MRVDQVARTLRDHVLSFVQSGSRCRFERPTRFRWIYERVKDLTLMNADAIAFVGVFKDKAHGVSPRGESLLLLP